MDNTKRRLEVFFGNPAVPVRCGEVAAIHPSRGIQENST
jgi:hypothetical protein